MVQIDAVIFDVGGVLLDWDPAYVYETLISDSERRDFFLNNVCTFEWHAQTDEGRTFAEIIETKKAEWPGRFDELIDAWWYEWEQMCPNVIEGTFEIASDIRRDYPDVPILGITNFSTETWPRLLELHPIFKDFFDDVVISGAEKMVKPDPEIYQLAIDRFKIEPGKAVFIDDKKENISAAQDAGFIGHLFQNPEKLRTFFNGTNLK